MITVVYCSRSSNRAHYDHIRKTSGLKNKIEVIEIINEGESLTKAYNRGLKQAKNDIVVFCHDDILFNKNGWARKIIKHFEETDYGILGVAGTTNLHESGRWWADGSKMVGIVKHSHNGRTFESKYSGNFGSEVIETVTVDGLFFAVHKDRIKEDFNEKVEGFHFYDIDFCFRNHLAGVKIGVMFDVKLTHKSIGQVNEQWEENRIKFASEYEDQLPRNIQVDPNYKYEVSELTNTPKLKIFIESKGNKESLKNLVEQIKDSGYPNYTISIVGDEDSIEGLEEFNSDKVKVYDGVYPSLHKNLSVLRWDADFVNEEDELIMFLSEDIILKTNVIEKFVSTYNKDKHFGCIFPRVINDNNTILSSGLEITLVSNEKNETTAKYNLKGINSYYNYNEGLVKEPLGNLSFCFMTTFENLNKQGWFRLDFENYLYECEFATKCSVDNKNVYVDNDSVVKLPYNLVADEERLKSLNADLVTFINCLKEIPKSVNFMKRQMVPSEELRKKHEQQQQQ